MITTIMDVQGVEINWTESGSGHPVILIHGNFSSHLWYTEQLLDPPDGLRLIALDMPNFGESGDMPGEIDMHGYARYVIGFADALGLEEFAVVGHSLGGAVAQAVAVTVPERVTHMLLVASAAPGGHHTSDELLAVLATLKGNREYLRAALATTIPSGLPDYFDAMVDDGMKLRPEGFTGNAVALMSFDVSDRTSNYTGPVLVIHGELDRPHLSTPEGAAGIAAAYPNGRLEVFEGVGHTPQLEAPERFRDTLVSFIREQP